MKEISLSQNQVATVDDADFNWLNRFKWSAAKGTSGYYAVATINSKQVSMHRMIMNTPDGMDTDHHDHNTLNNSRDNLRVCTRAENQHNRKANRIGLSRYKGVTWVKVARQWKAQIFQNGKNLNLGLFSTEKKAAKVYNRAAKKYFGSFAYLNVA